MNIGTCCVSNERKSNRRVYVSTMYEGIALRDNVPRLDEEELLALVPRLAGWNTQYMGALSACFPFLFLPLILFSLVIVVSCFDITKRFNSTDEKNDIVSLGIKIAIIHATLCVW